MGKHTSFIPRSSPPLRGRTRTQTQRASIAARTRGPDGQPLATDRHTMLQDTRQGTQRTHTPARGARAPTVSAWGRARRGWEGLGRRKRGSSARHARAARSGLDACVLPAPAAGTWRSPRPDRPRDMVGARASGLGRCVFPRRRVARDGARVARCQCSARGAHGARGGASPCDAWGSPHSAPAHARAGAAERRARRSKAFDDGPRTANEARTVSTLLDSRRAAPGASRAAAALQPTASLLLDSSFKTLRACASERYDPWRTLYLLLALSHGIALRPGGLGKERRTGNSCTRQPEAGIWNSRRV